MAAATVSRRARLGLVLVPALAALVVVGLAAPAGAAPLRRATALRVPGCDVVAGWTRLTQDSNGIAHGFAALRCGDTYGRINYLEGTGATWRTTRAPWTGRPLATASDTTGTYLLFERTADVGGVGQQSAYIAKRTPAGRFLPPRRIGQLRRGWQLTSGSVVAAGGRWWAVWSEEQPADVGGWVPVPGDLYQARTLGRTQLRTRITTDPGQDDTPHLLLRAGNGAAPVLYWRRHTSTMVATTTPAGPWRSRQFKADLDTIYSARVAGTATYLAWDTYLSASNPPPYREVRVTDNASGRFRTTIIGRSNGDYGPFIGVSKGRVFVSWETGTVGTTRGAQLAVRAGGHWATRALQPGSSGGQRIVAVVPRQGKAAVLVQTGPNLVAVYE
jgi:hypothetical protein